MIDGITREMLYGEDANQNGMLDPGEDLNGDGIFQPGWNAFLTVHSMESNLRTDGTEKLNINQSLLTELYDAVVAEFDEESAKFIVAIRMNGPLEPDVTDDGSGQSATSSGGQSSNGVVRDIARAVAKVVGGASDGSVTRGGMDLSGGAGYQFKSIYDLVGSQVTLDVDGKSTTLDSPWTTSASDMLQYLPILMDTFSLSDDTTILGRVNINEARYETLIGLPGMDANLANYIITQQMIDSSGQPLTDTIAQHGTTGWLAMNGQVDMPTMRQLDQFITARGDVFRAQVVGHFDAGGPVCRLEAIIDATQQPPKLLQLRDLTDLGRGFSQAQLLQQQ
jgi:DNA uptake protein ComE-like DNA-binding protein